MPECLPPSEQAIIEQFQHFIESELMILASQYSAQANPSILTTIRQRSQTLGFYRRTQPLEFGGIQTSPLLMTALTETLYAANLPFNREVFGPGPGILANASDEIKNRYLTPVLNGDMRVAFAFTEPSDGAAHTQAEIDGDMLVINGQKSYVTGGENADILTVFVHMPHSPAATPPSTGSQSIPSAMVIIPTTAKGVSQQARFNSLDGSHHAAFKFEQVRIPKTDMIGAIGEGMGRALSNIARLRLTVSAQAAGLCQWTLNYLADQLNFRQRNGKSLAERDSVKLRYADLRIQVYAARAMLYRTARLVDKEAECLNEVSATKVLVCELLNQVVDQAVQLVGGQALVESHPLAILYKRVRAYRLIEGASDVLRLNIAKNHLQQGQGRL